MVTIGDIQEILIAFGVQEGEVGVGNLTWEKALKRI